MLVINLVLDLKIFMKKVMVVFIIPLEEHLKMICLGENKTGLLKNI